MVLQDVEAQNFSKIFYLKVMSFKIANKYFGYFCMKICEKELSKIAQSGHTGSLIYNNTVLDVPRISKRRQSTPTSHPTTPTRDAGRRWSAWSATERSMRKMNGVMTGLDNAISLSQDRQSTEYSLC